MDNRYFNYKCPALMQDARFITSYMESRVFEQQIRNVNKLESAQDFKNFLQSNAETIMNNEKTYLESVNKCCVNGACLSTKSCDKPKSEEKTCGCDK